MISAAERRSVPWRVEWEDERYRNMLQAIVGFEIEIARIEGILLCPEGAATYAALRKALEDGRVGPTETAVLFNCATGLKYPMPAAGRPINLNEPRDFTALASE